MTTPIYRPFVNTENALIATMLSDFAQRFQTCIPAVVNKVISRDTVEVSPAVLQTDSQGDPVQWANITTTVLNPFSGGIFLSMPVAVGDTGWLVAADLDTSVFKQGKKPSQQNSLTRHLYEYGFFVPDAINGYTVSEDDAGAVVLSTLDGKTKITLKDKEINVVSDDKLKINAKSITIESSNNDVVIDGINFKNHKHVVEENGVPTLATTATVGASSTPGVISGTTGGVSDV